MKVYLVYWCNNEPYEDYYESVEAVFSTYKGAERYILDQGYHPHECKSEWEERNMAHYFDSEPDDYGRHHTMWIKDMEVDS